MFQTVTGPNDNFVLLPFPKIFHFEPDPFGIGALLILNSFGNDSDKLNSEHLQGINILAAQARATLSVNTPVLEVYGVTDRTGSESHNLALSKRRARAVAIAAAGALEISDQQRVFSNGLGERFAEEYFQRADLNKDSAFRGVLCYLWASFGMAMDPGLKLSIAFAAPPIEEGGFRRIFLAALHMGRHRALPRSPFA